MHEKYTQKKKLVNEISFKHFHFDFVIELTIKLTYLFQFCKFKFF